MNRVRRHGGLKPVILGGIRARDKFLKIAATVVVIIGRWTVAKTTKELLLPPVRQTAGIGISDGKSALSQFAGAGSGQCQSLQCGCAFQPQVPTATQGGTAKRWRAPIRCKMDRNTIRAHSK